MYSIHLILFDTYNTFFVLQPPSSILKAEFLDDTKTTTVTAQRSLDTKRSLQRTFRVDMNDPEQPLLLNEMHSSSGNY